MKRCAPDEADLLLDGVAYRCESKEAWGDLHPLAVRLKGMQLTPHRRRWWRGHHPLGCIQDVTGATVRQ